MSFWSADFMNDRRKQWLNALLKFEYLVDGTWYEAVINTKRIVGNMNRNHCKLSKNIKRIADY